MQLEIAINEYVSAVTQGIGTLFVYGIVILAFIALAKWVIVR